MRCMLIEEIHSVSRLHHDICIEEISSVFEIIKTEQTFRWLNCCFRYCRYYCCCCCFHCR